jgi:hypothetical protein
MLWKALEGQDEYVSVHYSKLIYYNLASQSDEQCLYRVIDSMIGLKGITGTHRRDL